MSLTYFISDIHLGAKSEDEEKERVTKFLNFLKEILHLIMPILKKPSADLNYFLSNYGIFLLMACA